MADRRFKNFDWWVATPDGKQYEPVNNAQLLAVLLDIRDEMQRLNGLLRCQNFLSIPQKLDRIGRNTAKKKRPVGQAAPSRGRLTGRSATAGRP